MSAAASRVPTLHAIFVHAGKHSFSKRSKLTAYIKWTDGVSGEFTASEFRGRFGVAASAVHEGEHLVDPLAIACSHCTAQPGAKCYILSRCGATTDRVHPSRLEAALTLAEKGPVTGQPVSA